MPCLVALSSGIGLLNSLTHTLMMPLSHVDDRLAFV